MPRRACRTAFRPSGCTGRRSPATQYAKRHCSYFPHSGAVIEQVEPDLLAGYDWAKGTLRFPVDQPPSEALVRRLVEIRQAMLVE
jgi:uncharacterized protein YdhG (YjbR/CyaY superfamily)